MNFISNISEDDDYIDFYDQMSDSQKSYILSGVKCHSMRIFCQESPIFKKSDIETLVGQSDFYDQCIEFAKEVMPQDTDWDFGAVVEEWVVELLSLSIPDDDGFLPTQRSREEIRKMLLGICMSTIHFCSEDYDFDLQEVIHEFLEYFQF